MACLSNLVERMTRVETEKLCVRLKPDSHGPDILQVETGKLL